MPKNERITITSKKIMILFLSLNMLALSVLPKDDDDDVIVELDGGMELLYDEYSLLEFIILRKYII